MNIAITGVTGDIGGAYLRSLNTQEHDVAVLLRENSEISVKNVKKHFYGNGFIHDSNFMKDFVKSDVLVHFAALLNSDDNDFVESMAVNAMLTGLITMTIQQSKTPQLIYISSEMVYKLPPSPRLNEISNKFIEFCQQRLEGADSYNLRALARTFIKQNEVFPFEEYNGYALSKYLGEVIVQTLSNSAVLRISNAYGPAYTNPRLIPRMIQTRLMGHSMTYTDEMRDFVYSDDIHSLISKVIDHSVSGIIDCRSNEIVNTKQVADMVIKATPTAYGELRAAIIPPQNPSLSHIPKGAMALAALVDDVTPFSQGFHTTMMWHKEQTYHQMIDGRSLKSFLKPDERIVKMLHGSSAAHLCVVADGNNVRKVRKIAIYDGVEGNGIAKVANEIKYYQHITEHEPGLAKIYPKLIESQIEETFSSETIEYLDGKNFYESMKDRDYSSEVYQASFKDFIGRLSSKALQQCVFTEDSESDLNTYYLERSLSRLHPIKDILEIENTTFINDKEYISPHIILSYLLSHRSFRQILSPKLQCSCFHGDLTLLNTVFLDESQEIRLIDPRGYIGQWDPLYDFGKIRFTLSGFGQMILDGKPMVTSRKVNHYKINFNQIPETALQLRDGFFGLLEEDATFRENIISREPHWQYRIALAEATHFLADIPFRLYTDGTTRTAIDSYVLGTYYLNQIYEALENEISNRG
jgi:nucleoside-diphosphate-sugar epimerase